MDSVPLLLLGTLLPMVFLEVYAALFARVTRAFVPLARPQQKPAVALWSESRIFGEEGQLDAFDLTRTALPLRVDYGAYGSGVNREALAVCLLFNHMEPGAAGEDPFLRGVEERCR